MLWALCWRYLYVQTYNTVRVFRVKRGAVVGGFCTSRRTSFVVRVSIAQFDAFDESDAPIFQELQHARILGDADALI